jgi:hypothetical protein
MRVPPNVRTRLRHPKTVARTAVKRCSSLFLCQIWIMYILKMRNKKKSTWEFFREKISGTGVSGSKTTCALYSFCVPFFMFFYSLLLKYYYFFPFLLACAVVVLKYIIARKKCSSVPEVHECRGEH